MRLLDLLKLRRALVTPGLELVFGVLHFNGYGVPMNGDDAERALVRAAESGLGFAQYLVGELWLRNPSIDRARRANAIRWLTEASAAGSALAAHRLAILHGEESSPEYDLRTCVTWTTKAAELGLPLAEYQLGGYLETGHGGLTADIASALKWYERAALHGLPLAMQRLADAYEGGELGVGIDGERASVLRNEAIKANQKRVAQETEDWITAAKCGDGAAQRLLSVGYREGLHGLPMDLAQADFWERRYKGEPF